jgi:plasmid stabilization system protein ParE
VTWVVRVVADAEAEFEAAARWYDEHAGLRTEFVEAIDEAIFAIAESPQRYPLWRADSPYRKYVVQRFPYLVLYRLREDYVEVMAFAHTRRRPGYWKHRS